MTSPTVSVVIPFYGDPAETLPLVESLQRQTRVPDQVIVADDASPTPFPDVAGVTVVRNPANGGFGTTCNSGAAVARGDLLLFLNSDLSLAEDFLAELLQAALPWQPALASPVLREGGRLRSTGYHFPTVWSTTMTWLTPLARWRDTRMWQRLVGQVDLAAMEPAGGPVDSVVGACMLVPRTAFEAVGGFDERFYMNSEEVDLHQRLVEAGTRTVLLPAVVVDHASGGSSESGSRRGWLTDGYFIYFHKRGRATHLRRALRVATWTNWAWNRLRQARGVDVDAARTRRHEMALIDHGYAARHGRPVPTEGSST